MNEDAAVSRFITHKLKLKVNEAKSAVARPQERKFLGFSLPTVPRSSASFAQDPGSVQAPNPGDHATGQRCQIKTTMAELASYMRGWPAISAKELRLAK
jgi:RNA-directed DNA polymerase